MKKMKYSLASALLLVFALSGAVLAQAQLNLKLPPPEQYVAPAGSPVAKYGHLSISRGYMFGELRNGKRDTVQLRGMSFFWGNAGEGLGRAFYNDDVVGWMVHDFKVDVLRAAIGPNGADKGGGGVAGSGYIDGGESQQWANVKTVVEGAIKRGIYVIVDWHSHRATKYQTESVAFFKRVAKEYGGYPNVIYEIYNEPCSDSDKDGQNESWSTLRSYSEAVIKGIRDEGSDNVVIVGTPYFSSLGDYNNSYASTILGDTVKAGNVAYSLHFYAGSSAHNAYRDRAISMVDGGKAVFVSEFGASASSGSGTLNTGNANTWITGTLNPKKISWVNWSITNKNESSAILNSTVTNSNGGWSASDLSVSGTWIRTTLRASGSGTTATSYAIDITPSEGGSVTKTPNKATYDYDEKVTLKATRADGYEFSGWSGDLAGTGDSYTLTVKGINYKIGASFFRGGLIKNGAFNLGFTTSPVTWAQTVNFLGSGTAKTPTAFNSEFKTDITKSGANVEHIFTYQNNIELEGGKGYRLSFRAKADTTRRIAVAVAGSADNARTTRYMTPREILLTDGWQDYNIDFVANAAGKVNARVEFWYGVVATNWSMTGVGLLEGSYTDGGSGFPFDPANSAGKDWDKDYQQNSTLPRGGAVKTAWSVARAGGGLRLSGPDMSGGAKVSFYDVRGRMVKKISLAGGSQLMLNSAVVPAGSYLLVVRNNSGKEVYKTRVLLAK